MAYTDEELDEKRQRIAALRDDIAEAEEEKSRQVAEAGNEVEGKLLDDEVARLEAQLAAVTGAPAPVEVPDIGAGDTEVVETKAAPSTGQTPTSGSPAKEPKSADTSTAKTDKE